VARLIEPRIARSVARRLAGEGPAAGSYLVDRLRADLGEVVPLSERLVAEASGIPAPPPVSWGLIGRAEWADTNIAGMTALLSPLANRLESRLEELPLALRLAQRTLVSAEVGVLVGYVSRRVLGQYDLLVPPEGPASARGRLFRSRSSRPGPVLLFVAPNIVETEQRFGFVPRDFALWVALHEVAHRFQFDGVPWLRGRFLELVTGYLSSVNLDARTLARRLASAAGALLSRSLPPEERNPLYLLASEDQRAALDDIQALMAVVEGHGNYVMDSVGARVIPSFPRMRRVFERRREQTRGLQRAVQYVIGLEMKLRQYELGQSFCKEVVARRGPQVLSKLWVAPEGLPTMAELREPDRWLARVA
jgi:coenzyme F420 biosynthesis associated uncharacterized protein